jgi:hypothetical protein
MRASRLRHRGMIVANKTIVLRQKFEFQSQLKPVLYCKNGVVINCYKQKNRCKYKIATVPELIK